VSLLLDGVLAQAANGSPATVALSSESVAVVLFASHFLEMRLNWLDKQEDLMDEVTEADWDEIEKLVGNLYSEIMTPIDITPIGTLAMWAAAAAPTKWLLCDGASVLRTTYADLFAVIGTTYGAVDGTHFTLPDMSGRSPMMPGAGVVNALAQQAGADAVALAITNLPAHDQDFVDIGHQHDQQVSAASAYLATGGSGRSAFAAVGTNSLTRAHTDTGGGGITFHSQGSNTPHANLHPVLGVNFIIYAGV